MSKFLINQVNMMLHFLNDILDGIELTQKWIIMS